jgi:anaerobic selenocysteine-containing dehydrogenase
MVVQTETPRVVELNLSNLDRYSPDVVSQITRVPAEQLLAAAEVLARHYQFVTDSQVMAYFASVWALEATDQRNASSLSSVSIESSSLPSGC